MRGLTPTPASTQRQDLGRNLLFVAIWLAWIGAALFALFSLGLYQKRALLERPLLTPAEQQSVAGWSLRHLLTGPPAIADAILQSLAVRGLRTGLHEELWVENETILARQLRTQGWPVHLLPSSSPAPSPRLEIISPAGEVVWLGTYQPADFLLGPAVIWDLRVLSEITRGQPFPAVVPVGCAAPGPASGPVADFAWLKTISSASSLSRPL